MSDYHRDAALDQHAECEEECRMDEYMEQQWEKWNESVAICSSPITAWGTNECGIRSVAEDNHAYSEGRHCEAWSPEEYEEDKNAPDTEVLPEAPDQDVVVKNFRYISASESTTDILQKIEKDAEKQIELLAEQDIPICEEICKNIMQRGADEFRQQTGRNMTYSEMRRAFG